MNPSAKAQISRASLSLLILVATLLLLGVVVLVVCSGLQINPFRETTTSFLVAAFVGLIGVAVVLVLLNVAVNISLITDAQVAALKIEPSQQWLKRWLIGFSATAVLVVGIIFVGTYLSKERFLGVVRRQADLVLNENRGSLEEMSKLLASGKLEDFKRIHEIKTYLTSQRSDLPALTIIYSGKFGNKLTFYQTTDYFYSADRSPEYSPQYFSCTAQLDCDYLTKFFSGGNVEVFQKYTIREDQFFIYIPFAGKESRYVFLFQRRNSYGKLGS